jgi:hypothetical protein
MVLPSKGIYPSLLTGFESEVLFSKFKSPGLDDKITAESGLMRLDFRSVDNDK